MRIIIDGTEYFLYHTNSGGFEVYTAKDPATESGTFVGLIWNAQLAIDNNSIEELIRELLRYDLMR